MEDRNGSALGKVQRRYVDEVGGQAVYFGHIEQGDAAGIATLRIRVVNKKITEGELVIGQKVDGMFNAEALVTNAPPEAPIAKAAHSSRQAMVAAARSYFDGIERHDSSLVLGQKGCVRIENGVMTAGPISEGGAFPVKGDCESPWKVFKGDYRQRSTIAIFQ